MSRDKPATEATVVERSIEREMQASQKQRQEPVSRQESKTDAVAPEQSFERGMQPTSLQQDQIPRQDSETDEVVEEGGIKREVEPALQQQDTRSREESETEEIVEEGGITPGMQRTFVSKRHGFRLHVQGGGVPDKQISGPITVTPLKESFMFEGVKLEGVLEVRCLPAGCQFDRPLLFDFPVEGRSKGCPVIDELGRIGYEVRQAPLGDIPYRGP